MHGIRTSKWVVISNYRDGPSLITSDPFLIMEREGKRRGGRETKGEGERETETERKLQK